MIEGETRCQQSIESTSMKNEFGSCCEDLTKGMKTVPNSFFKTDDNGVLFLTIGYSRMEKGTAWFDAAIFFCPFCGSRLQDRPLIKDASK